MTKPTMLSYIYSEEAQMKAILATYPANFEAATALSETQEWLVLGTGSSINAAYSAKYYIEKMADVRMDIQEPFNFTHYEKVSPHIQSVLGISQSGQSSSTIEALQKINAEHSLPTLAVTSRPESEITKFTTNVLDIGSGQERVGYVTVGFTATVLSLMLLGLRIGVKKGLISAEQEAAELTTFAQMTEQIQSIIDKTEAFFELNKADFKAAPRFSAVGYGPAVGTVKEMETKFSETVRVPSQGIELEAFMHGPYLEVNPEHRIFFVETPSPVLTKATLLKQYEAKQTSHVFTLTTEASTDSKTLGLDYKMDELKAPYLLIIPFQILAWRIATEKGIDLTKRIYTDFSQAVHRDRKSVV